jgi:2-polyprenyl-3-methyl-5-hydroxy-6-metoxy-1,4-benzoquinol methylase
MNIILFNKFCSDSDTISLEDGIWHSSKSANISYPDEGYNACFDMEETSFWFQHRNNCIVSLVKKYASNDLFFDVGGGNGFVSKAIEEAGIEGVLLEPGYEGVLNAKKRHIKNVFCGTLNDLSGLEGHIQAMGTFDVIEHIKDDAQFVNEVCNMLKQGGVFFATVPAYKFLWSDEDTDAGHFRRYTRKSITSLLKDNGFEIVYSSYFFSVLIIPIFVFRTLPSKFGIKRKTNTIDKKEHKQKTGFVGKILNLIWNFELERIQNNKFIPFGTSCLIVAKKKGI